MGLAATFEGRAPLPRASAIVHLLETTGGPARVHPDDETSVFTLLPREDAAWMVETAADVIAAVPGPSRHFWAPRLTSSNVWIWNAGQKAVRSSDRRHSRGVQLICASAC